MATAKKSLVKHDAPEGVVRAVIYARYSCSSQNECSIEGQLIDCRAYAERCGFLVVGEYIDRALTGRSDDRAGFQRMIEDSRRGEFERVIVWKLDRFARNRYDSAAYKYRLKQNGVSVCSAMENIGDGDESVILEAVLEAVAEYYSLDLAKKVRRGMREAATAGRSTGSKPPYGYKLIPDAATADRKRPGKRPVPDGERAEFVKWAYSVYADGTAGPREIFAEMQRRGLDSIDGRKVAYQSIGRMLRNPKYKGEASWGEIAYSWPAIVDADVWERARLRREANSRAPGRAKAAEHYDLCGKVFCGECGEPMIGTAGTGNSGNICRYYSCRGRKKLRTGCHKAHEKKDFLEWYVVEQTLLYVLDKERRHYIAERVVAKYEEEYNDSEAQALERRVAAIDRDLGKTTELLFAAPSRAAVDRINEHVRELEAQKDELTVELSKLRIAAGIRYTVREVETWLKGFCTGDACDPDFRRRIIEVFVNSVYVYDDRIVIYYNLRDGRQTIITGPDAGGAATGGTAGPKNKKSPAASGACKGSYFGAFGSPNQSKYERCYYIFVGGTFGICVMRSGQ